MTTTITVGFFDFDTNRRLGVEHFGSDVGALHDADVWKQIENRMKQYADTHGVEIDVRTAVLMPSGKVADWDCVGMRCEPS
jgi:hypothetical protein